MLPEIGTYLVGEMPSLALGTNLFLGLMPESPDVCVAMYESASSPPVFMLGGDGSATLESPRLQVHVRHTAYATGKSLAQDIWTALSKVENVSLSGVLYLRLHAIDSPVFFTRDTNTRLMFTMNFETYKAPGA